MTYVSVPRTEHLLPSKEKELLNKTIQDHISKRFEEYEPKRDCYGKISESFYMQMLHELWNFPSQLVNDNLKEFIAGQPLVVL